MPFQWILQQSVAVLVCRTALSASCLLLMAGTSQHPRQSSVPDPPSRTALSICSLYPDYFQPPISLLNFPVSHHFYGIFRKTLTFLSRININHFFCTQATEHWTDDDRHSTRSSTYLLALYLWELGLSFLSLSFHIYPTGMTLPGLSLSYRTRPCRSRCGFLQVLPLFLATSWAQLKSAPNPTI